MPGGISVWMYAVQGVIAMTLSVAHRNVGGNAARTSLSGMRATVVARGFTAWHHSLPRGQATHGRQRESDPGDGGVPPAASGARTTKATLASAFRVSSGRAPRPPVVRAGLLERGERPSHA